MGAIIFMILSSQGPSMPSSALCLNFFKFCTFLKFIHRYFIFLLHLCFLYWITFLTLIILIFINEISPNILYLLGETGSHISLSCASEDNLELLILWPPLLELQVDVTPSGLFSAGDQPHAC